MVKVQSFAGAVFHSQDYSRFLHSNIQHLEATPMASTFDIHDFMEKGLLLPEPSPCSYIYRQEYKSHLSLGIIAQISIEDYHNGKIKKHQKTLKRPGLNHLSYTKQHVGPVVVSYPKHQELQQSIGIIVSEHQPFSEWNTKDGRKHSLWKINTEELDLVSKFATVDSLYILDGHHRLEAAHQNYLYQTERRPWDNWIQAIIYSSHYVRVEPFHRVINSKSKNPNILHKLSQLQNLEITKLSCDSMRTMNLQKEFQIYEVLLKLDEQLFGINFKADCRNILEKVTSFRLQKEILETILHQEEEKHINYLPGIIEQAEVLTHQFVFLVRGPSIETVFQIADESISMPPKSTWIEPKPCSHMVIRLTH